MSNRVAAVHVGQRLRFSKAALGCLGQRLRIVSDSAQIAGKVHIDDTAAGGGKVDADFDLTVMSTFKSVH